MLPQDASKPESQTGFCVLIWALRAALLLSSVLTSGIVASPVFAVLLLLSVCLHGPFVRHPLSLLDFKVSVCRRLLLLVAALSSLHLILTSACVSREGARILHRIGYSLVDDASLASSYLIAPSLVVLLTIGEHLDGVPFTIV